MVREKRRWEGKSRKKFFLSPMSWLLQRGIFVSLGSHRRTFPESEKIKLFYSRLFHTSPLEIFVRLLPSTFTGGDAVTHNSSRDQRERRNTFFLCMLTSALESGSTGGDEGSNGEWGENLKFKFDGCAALQNYNSCTRVVYRPRCFFLSPVFCTINQFFAHIQSCHGKKEEMTYGKSYHDVISTLEFLNKNLNFFAL